MPAQPKVPSVINDHRMLDIDAAMQCPPGEVFCLANMVCVPDDENAPCESESIGEEEHKCDSGQVSKRTLQDVHLVYSSTASRWASVCARIKYNMLAYVWAVTIAVVVAPLLTITGAQSILNIVKILKRVYSLAD
jgi:hypothetical protein